MPILKWGKWTIRAFLGFKSHFCNSGLSNNAEQRAATDGIMKRDRNRNRSVARAFLEDAVTALLSNRYKTVLF
jgi:hypothetical protein